MIQQEISWTEETKLLSPIPNVVFQENWEPKTQIKRIKECAKHIHTQTHTKIIFQYKNKENDPIYLLARKNNIKENREKRKNREKKLHDIWIDHGLKKLMCACLLFLFLFLRILSFFAISFVCFFAAFKYLRVEVDIAIAFGRSKNKAITTHEKKIQCTKKKKICTKTDETVEKQISNERKKQQKRNVRPFALQILVELLNYFVSVYVCFSCILFK